MIEIVIASLYDILEMLSHQITAIARKADFNFSENERHALPLPLSTWKTTRRSWWWEPLKEIGRSARSKDITKGTLQIVTSYTWKAISRAKQRMVPLTESGGPQGFGYPLLDKYPWTDSSLEEWYVAQVKWWDVSCFVMLKQTFRSGFIHILFIPSRTFLKASPQEAP